MKSYRQGPETKRLLLRAMTVDDADVFLALRSHAQVIRYTGDEPFHSIEEARTAIEQYPDFETVGFGRWGCVLKESRAVIGFCGLKYLPELDAVDLGYRLLPEYWGQGLATEASQACIAFGFDVLGLDRIIGLVIPQNAASIRVLEKVGMKLDGEIEYEGQAALQYSVRRAVWTRAGEAKG